MKTNKNGKENKSENKNKKQKQKWKLKWKQKRKWKRKFRFGFCFCFSKVFAFLLTPRGPRGAIDGQLSLDWPRSAIAPRKMAPSLIGKCRIQWCCSFFLLSSGNTLFGQI